MQRILDKITELAQRANGKKFRQTQSMLLRIHTTLSGLAAADISPTAKPIIMTVLAGFEAELLKKGATDRNMHLAASTLAQQLLKTNNVLKQLEDLAAANTLNAAQRREYQRILGLVAARLELSLRDLKNFNRSLQRIAMQSAPAPAPQPVAPQQPEPTTGIRGWANKLLEGMTAAFRAMNSTGDEEEKQNALLQGTLPFAGFFVHILGSFFKAIFGKGSEAKIDEFTEAGSEALTGWLQAAHTKGVAERRAEEAAARSAASAKPSAIPPSVSAASRRPRSASHPVVFSPAARQAAQATTRATAVPGATTPAPANLADLTRRVARRLGF